MSSDSKRGVHTSKTVANNNSKIPGKSKSIVKQHEKKGQPSRERISRTIKANKRVPRTAAGKPARDSKLKVGTAKTTNSGKIMRETESIVKPSGKQARTSVKNRTTKKHSSSRTNKSTSLRTPSLFTRPANERSQHIRPRGEKSQHIRREGRKVIAESRPAIAHSRKVISRRRKHPRGDESSSRRRYREVRDVVKEVRHHEHVYMDRHNRIRRRRIWPRDRFVVHYNRGPHRTFRYFYPYHHRRYVFVSLGGYWPVDYRYVRYYWYGCHPYTWYGYYPITREVEGGIYNYYTYNYYSDETAGYQSYQSTGDITTVDHSTFADIRERLAAQAAEEPESETLADRYFDDAVKAFETGDYEGAAKLFAQAMELAPKDIILPFAYSQALFANEQYAEAAKALRAALVNVSPEKEGVFYPRGLYPEEDVLFEQIDQLAVKAELYSFDGDLQLLLGYHLLGIGEIEAAVEPLRLANQDLENASSAAVLLSLAEKMRIQNTEDTDK